MAANALIGPWLVQVANDRVHGTTGEKPSARMELERSALQPLPIIVPAVAPASVIRAGLAVPHESLQHPLMPLRLAPAGGMMDILQQRIEHWSERLKLS